MLVAKAVSWRRGFVYNFLRVLLACRGYRADEVLLWNAPKIVFKHLLQVIAKSGRKLAKNWVIKIRMEKCSIDIEQLLIFSEGYLVKVSFRSYFPTII